jgi:tRNA threonylcarbamoyladenosine modification (KEOPS) complex Cgi121 subunit
MGLTCVIVKEFYIKEMDLKYFIGISQIEIELNQFLEVNKISNEEEALNHLFKIIEELQNKNKELTIQIIKDKYVLNLEHIFVACYYLQKTSFHETLISNKKAIELLLYLSTHRQIRKGIKLFGLDYNDLKEGKFIICIISPVDNLKSIHSDVLETLNAHEIELTINDLTLEKITEIIKVYEFSCSQINSVLKSYGIKNINWDKPKNKLNDLSIVIFDLICEKMALLNLEKIRST